MLYLINCAGEIVSSSVRANAYDELLVKKKIQYLVVQPQLSPFWKKRGLARVFYILWWSNFLLKFLFRNDDIIFIKPYSLIPLLILCFSKNRLFLDVNDPYHLRTFYGLWYRLLIKTSISLIFDDERYAKLHVNHFKSKVKFFFLSDLPRVPKTNSAILAEKFRPKNLTSGINIAWAGSLDNLNCSVEILKSIADLLTIRRLMLFGVDVEEAKPLLTGLDIANLKCLKVYSSEDLERLHCTTHVYLAGYSDDPAGQYRGALKLKWGVVLGALVVTTRTPAVVEFGKRFSFQFIFHDEIKVFFNKECCDFSDWSLKLIRANQRMHRQYETAEHARRNDLGNYLLQTDKDSF